MAMEETCSRSVHPSPATHRPNLCEAQMTTSTEWIAGGSELLDIVFSTGATGAHQLERPDRQSLILLILSNGDGLENGEKLFADLVAASAGSDLHVVLVEHAADEDGLRRTRIASDASVYFDEPISLEDVRQHLLRWWGGEA